MRSSRFVFLLVVASSTLLIAAPSKSADHGDPAGSFVLTVLTADPGAFGYPAAPPNRFVGTFQIRIEAPLPPDPIPDGDYEATFAKFELTIGDTSWDATMPHDAPLVRFQGGEPIGWVSTLTVTRPGHPDLQFTLPNSPGTWEAIDDDGVSNNGAITGTYVLETQGAPGLGLGARVLVIALLVASTAMVLLRRRSHVA